MSEQNTPDTLYCYRHPERETSLRCNLCEQPMCVSCAVRTPTGYRCKDCIRGQQKVFDTAQPMDYVWAVAISGVLSFLGSLLVSFVGFFTLFLAPLSGIVLGEAVRVATGKRRSKALFKAVVITSVVGALPLLVVSLISALFSLRAGGIFGILGLVWQAYYLVSLTGGAYYRLSGKTLRLKR